VSDYPLPVAGSEEVSYRISISMWFAPVLICKRCPCLTVLYPLCRMISELALCWKRHV